MNTNSLSVFFPCINEEGNVVNTVKLAEEFLDKLKLKYEIIIVDDGSTDKTGQIADQLSSKDSHIRVIHHPNNLGYGEALKSGFYNSRYDTIVYTDGDRQFDFTEVSKFLEKIKDHDVVIGYRMRRQDNFIRKLFGKGWRLSLLVFFGLKLKDVDCGFKMVTKKVLEKIPHLQSQRGAMINAELAIKAKKYGFKIGQVGVTHYPRVSGRPTGANIKVIFKSYLDLVRLWWKLKDGKIQFLLLLSVILLATFLRFYQLPQYMTFLGDEGRDALVIKGMFFDYNFPLIGPPTSVGNIYLGPLYYYMMAVPMLIFWLNPVAAAAMNAFLGVATVIFIYYLGKLWFNRWAGLISAYLYAISPVAIIYSRSSWNPNPTPLFALISIFSLYKVNQTRNFLWLILTGLSIGAALQMHYLAGILIPVAIAVWFYEAISLKIWGKESKSFLKGTILGIISFVFTLIPLILFDLKHNYLNYRAITELFNSGDAVKSNLFVNISKLPTLFSHNLIGRYLAGENLLLIIIVSLIIIFAMVYKLSSWPKIALGIWLIVGLFGLTFYQQDIHDHYLGFVNPAPFLLFGSVAVYVSTVSAKKRWLAVGGAIALLVALTFINLAKNPLNNLPNNQLKRTQDVARFIINKANNQDFNFALLAQSNYDAAYQFYLEMFGFTPKQVPSEKTSQLFVVCEDEVCDPTHSPKYEIAAYGWSKIDWMENVYGVKIYKLIPNLSGKP